MKKFLILLAISVGSTASAQQISLNSQYLFNETLINPGATGSKDYVPVHLNYRQQWVRFPGAPTTQVLSSHGAVAKNMGVGGVVFNDVAGPSRRTGINFNTAYHLRLDANNEHRLGLGLGVSLIQNTMDMNELETFLPEDEAILRGFNNQLVPDANFGVYYHYKNKAFAGLSAHNLIEMRRNLYDFQDPFNNPLNRTYYFLGGYNFELGSKFTLKTSTLVQMIETTTTQFDVTAIGVYNNFIWLGASYRHTDAVAFMIGGQAGPFRIGYSYDYTLSDIANYSSGSHEVFLEVQFYRNPESSRTPWLKRNRIYAPKI